MFLAGRHFRDAPSLQFGGAHKGTRPTIQVSLSNYRLKTSLIVRVGLCDSKLRQFQGRTY